MVAGKKMVDNIDCTLLHVVQRDEGLCSPVSMMTVASSTVSVSVQGFPLVVTQSGLYELGADGVFTHEGDGLSSSASTAHAALPRLSHSPDKPESNNRNLSTQVIK